jgi:dephospho-CoA kinase
VLLVALTGGIATGKSHCLDRLAQLGAVTISADQLARAAVAPGTRGLDLVIERFGRGVLHEDGTLNREALAGVVFADAAARRDLEAIVHPRVYDEIREWASGDYPPGTILIADIPLLYETGRDRDFEQVIVAACRPDQQLARLVGRDGLTPAEAQQRVDSQMPIAEKVGRATYVIDTSGTYEDTDRGIQSVWKALRSSAA